MLLIFLNGRVVSKKHQHNAILLIVSPIALIILFLHRKILLIILRIIMRIIRQLSCIFPWCSVGSSVLSVGLPDRMIGLTRIGVVASIVFLYQVLSLLASSTKYLMAKIIFCIFEVNLEDSWHSL